MKKQFLYILTSTFILASCGGGGGGGSIEFPSNPIVPPTTVNLSAEPTLILVDETATLSWSSTNATSCSANWTEKTTSSGSEVITVGSTGINSFSISCTGPGGTTQATVDIEVHIFNECMDDEIAVSNINELNESMTLSSGSGRDDVIYLKDGIYLFDDVIVYDAQGTTENLILKGCFEGNSNIVFDGQNKSRIFEFQKNGPSSVDNDPTHAQPPFPSLEIYDVTFTGARWDSIDTSGSCWSVNGMGCGSAIYADRYHLKLHNVSFIDNEATSGTSGGHLVNNIVNLEISDSEFNNNTANGSFHAGIIRFAGDLNISNTRFINNTGGYSLHAGIHAYVNCHKRTIKDSLFESNHYAYYSLIWDCGSEDKSEIQQEIINSDFIDNKYAFVIRGTNVNIINSRFIGNYLGYGNYNEGMCDNDLNGTFDGTQITGHDMNCITGAAIMFDKYMYDWSVLNIQDSTFSNNSARDFGGAIDMLGSVRCDESDYFRYACEDVSDEPYYDLIINNSTFSGNESHRGAAISIAKRGPQKGNVLIENSTFTQNIATVPDGYEQNVEDIETSVLVVGGDAEISNTTFSDNEADFVIQVKGSLSCDNSC